MKVWILHLLKALGFFHLCRRLVADKTLVLAYHGFEIADETGFRPQLFIKPETLERRLAYLQKHCNIIALDDYDKHSPVKNKVVITVDDGWYSTLTLGAPIFNKFDMPYTVYLTTENVLDNQPIYHVALSYILHKNVGKRLQYGNGGKFELDVVITEQNIPEIVEATTPAKREKNDTELLRAIAKALNFDFETTIENRALTLMDVRQVREIQALGADIQLHTHTHNTPLYSYPEFCREIEENRTHITDITGIRPEHHCYPSGVYNENSFGYLKRLGVKSATTCYPGFVDRHTNPMEVPRFLDSERIPQIVFEAEVSGVQEVLRNVLRGKIKPMINSVLRPVLARR